MPDPYRETTEEKSEAVKELEQMPSPPETKEQPIAPKKVFTAPQEQAPPPTPASVSAPPQTTASQPAPVSVSTDLENDRQLKILVDLAFTQGIDKAVKAARASENPYLIDKFHDTLVDELRQKLVEDGKLKEV